MTTTVVFSFNTALSGIESETGKWDQPNHDVIAKRIRGHIMSQPSGDGISEMSIHRYGMRVGYEPEVTTREKVVAAVEEAITWAIATIAEAFPIREDKTPEATLDVHVQRPTGRTVVEAKLETDLYMFPTNDSKRDKLHKKLAKELLNFEGIRSYGIYINAIVLTISEKTATIEDAKAHISNILKNHSFDVTSEFVPFTKGREVDIIWSIRPIMQ